MAEETSANYQRVFKTWNKLEYAYTLKVDEKSDMYSFGVVLLEMLTGRSPAGVEFGDGVDIVRCDRPQDGRVPDHGVVHLFGIATWCVEEESYNRPTMREMVHILTNPTSPAPALNPKKA